MDIHGVAPLLQVFDMPCFGFAVTCWVYGLELF